MRWIFGWISEDRRTIRTYFIKAARLTSSSKLLAGRSAKMAEQRNARIDRIKSYWHDIETLIKHHVKYAVCTYMQIHYQHLIELFLKTFVRFFFLKDWFQCINWLKLELQLNVLVIQTNRCFIKSKIRDLLCTRRLSIEILSDYRISLIIDLFVIFTVFETKICEIFLITSLSDAYIEVCSLKSEHQCRTITFSFLVWIVANRLFDFDLHRYTIFFQRDRNFMRSENLLSFMTWSSFLIVCFHVNRHISDVEIALKCKSVKRKKEKTQAWMNYIILRNKIAVESSLAHVATTTINKIITETLATCLTFTDRRSTFSSITRWWRRRLMTFSRNLFSKIVSKMAIRKKIWRRKIEKSERVLYTEDHFRIETDSFFDDDDQ